LNEARVHNYDPESKLLRTDQEFGQIIEEAESIDLLPKNNCRYTIGIPSIQKYIFKINTGDCR
jgi:hypothetical protein